MAKILRGAENVALNQGARKMAKNLKNALGGYPFE